MVYRIRPTTAEELEGRIAENLLEILNQQFYNLGVTALQQNGRHNEYKCWSIFDITWETDFVSYSSVNISC